MRIPRLLLVAAATTALVLPAAPALAAHNGNNKAPLVGEDASGTALLNYSEGTSSFSGGVNVQGLEVGETYTFTVTSPAGAVTAICSFVADGGNDGCSVQQLALGGFARADIREGEGILGASVAGGAFERRGNCRDAGQAGTQCEANDTRQNVITP